MNRFYMHLLGGQPAFYEKGRQVCYAKQGRYGHVRQQLVPTLKQLKAEQKASIAWRRKQGMGDTPAEYGYCVVGVPEGKKDAQPATAEEYEQDKRDYYAGDSTR